MLDAFLTDLLTQTRALALTYWRQGFAVDTKPDRTLVTEADRAIEALIRDRVKAAFPSDGLFGEEYGVEALGADRVWVIDPIDGTQAFVMGVPVFSTLIAVLQQGEVTHAAADFPALDLSARAVKGQGAYMNEERLRVSQDVALEVATLTATSTTMFSGDDAHRFQKLVAATGSVRFGLDAFGFCTLARGRADVVVEACLKPYDFMAPSLIVAEAGGLMTDWRGNPLNLNSEGKVVAAASPQLHASALSILA